MAVISHSARSRLRMCCYALTAGIVVVSLSPGRSVVYRLIEAVSLGERWDHFVAYGLCASLALFAWERRRPAMLLSATLALLGVLLELAHLRIPGRSCDLFDALASLMGLGAGLLLGLNLRLMLNTPDQQKEARP